MKQILTFIYLFFLLSGTMLAQQVPMGMKYQAVARDNNGKLMADQHLRIEIRLYAESNHDEIVYTETHDATTTELGLFNLTIGEGQTMGKFHAVPWGTKEIWMEVAIQSEAASEFITISDSKMLSVPYAFHAATAGELIGADSGSRGGSTGDPYVGVWTLAGNVATNPLRDKLGTADLADLVIVTNNKERMRITSEGDLSVQRNVYLNTEEPPVVGSDPNFEKGKTINNGDFIVENGSRTHLTGDLVVNKNVSIGGNTDITGGLHVQQSTLLHTDATVYGLAAIKNLIQSEDPFSGGLLVYGGVGSKKI